MDDAALAEAPNNITRLVRYPITPAEIRALKARTSGLSADTREGYEAIRLAIGECVKARSAVDVRRKDLNADALAWQREVNAIAKDLTAAIEEVEEPLRAKKQAVDDEKARLKREKEEAAKRALEEELRKKREADEAIAKALRDAEEARIAKEREALEAEKAKARAAQEAEAKRQAEERRQLDEERAKHEAAKREAEAKLAEERRQIDEQRKANERVEIERQARIKAEADAKERAEREVREAEERRVADLERREANRKRLEAIRPDVEKLRAFAKNLRELEPPSVDDVEAQKAIAAAKVEIDGIAERVEAFADRNTAPNQKGAA